MSELKCVIGSGLIACLALSACGGGGGGGGPMEDADLWRLRTAGSEKLAQICESPRIGPDPYNGNQPYPDLPGTLTDEKSWLRRYMGEVYLWYREIPSVNANNFSSTEAYFYNLLTPRTTPSGKFKDEFSFVFPTDAWNALSQDGIFVSYGAQFALVSDDVYVAYVETGTPAAAAGLSRGDRVLQIDGVAVSQADTQTLFDALYPDFPGESHRFVIRDRGASATRDITLRAEPITTTPVPVVKTVAGGTVGYLLFNDHVATAESQLLDAITELQAAGIDDLVLDLRYNGGGFLDIASELAFMIAGSSATTGKTFEKLSFNDKNPLARAPDADTGFRPTTLGFDPAVPSGTALPQLRLSRVFVLADRGTCSASEAIINGLRGIDVEVVLIGDTTCGKPYGFFQQDNCGLSYFAIEFSGVNQKGFGDYADGFDADCVVEDDFEHDLGDPQEALLGAALQYRNSGVCPVSAKSGSALSVTKLIRSPLRENRYYRLPAR